MFKLIMVIFIVLILTLLFLIFFFISICKKSGDYYKLIHNDLLNLVPLKIDLKRESVFFNDKLVVLNNKKTVSFFVFKSMVISHSARMELEILLQNLLSKNYKFVPTKVNLSFQLQNKIIVYELFLTTYDDKTGIIYGQMQSNNKYDRFSVPESVKLKSNNFLVDKLDFAETALKTFYEFQDEYSLYEYMFLIKIKNYSILEKIFTYNNITNINLLICAFVKNKLGENNTVICKYYDGQILVYSKNKKIKLSSFQKKLNNYIKSNLTGESSYLQIQVQIISVFNFIKMNNSNMYSLYDAIIELNSNEQQDLGFTEKNLKVANSYKKPVISQYELLYSPRIWDFLIIKIFDVYKNDNSNLAFYYSTLDIIKNDYYDDYKKLMLNICRAGLWWKVYEPLFLKILENYSNLDVKKDLVITLLLSELENKTVLTQILNIVKKRKTKLFKNCSLIFNFQDHYFNSINNYKKYENIINTLRANDIKISFSHDVKNLNNFNLVGYFKPDLVVLEQSLIQKSTFDFDKFIKLTLCLNYLKMLQVKNILSYGVNNSSEVILFKSLKIKYLTGDYFQKNKENSSELEILKYKSYWKFKKDQALKGEK